MIRPLRRTHYWIWLFLPALLFLLFIGGNDDEFVGQSALFGANIEGKGEGLVEGEG